MTRRHRQGRVFRKQEAAASPRWDPTFEGLLLEERETERAWPACPPRTARSRAPARPPLGHTRPVEPANLESCCGDLRTAAFPNTIKRCVNPFAAHWARRVDVIPSVHKPPTTKYRRHSFSGAVNNAFQSSSALIGFVDERGGRQDFRLPLGIEGRAHPRTVARFAGPGTPPLTERVTSTPCCSSLVPGSFLLCHCFGSTAKLIQLLLHFVFPVAPRFPCAVRKTFQTSSSWSLFCAKMTSASAHLFRLLEAAGQVNAGHIVHFVLTL